MFNVILSFTIFIIIGCIFLYYYNNQYIRTNYLCNNKVYYTNHVEIPPPTDTVLFTMLINIPLSWSKYYFLSLIKVKYKGLIVILTDNKTQKFYNTKLHIHYIELTDYYPFYPLKHNKYPISPTYINYTIPYFITNLPVFYIRNVVRYFIFYMWLKEYGSKYKYFIFSDLRDVAFQKHPFQWNICKGVILTEETNLTSLLTISPQFNIQYFKNRSRMNHTVLNGGLIYGTYNELTQFLQYYTKLYRKFGFAGNDQSLLNYIYYEIKPKSFIFPVIVQKEATGYSRCLASFLDMTNIIPFDKTGLIVNNDGKTYPTVLHQYTSGFYSGTNERKKMFEVFRSNLIN